MVATTSSITVEPSGENRDALSGMDELRMQTERYGPSMKALVEAAFAIGCTTQAAAGQVLRLFTTSTEVSAGSRPP
jgi:hypothetical protein